MLAAERVTAIGFRRYIVSATTPIREDHLARLRADAPAVISGLFPDYQEEFGRRGWKMLQGIDRVYVNQRARDELGWNPRFDFRHVLDRLGRGESPFSDLARAVGNKGYHSRSFADGPYPVESGG